MALGGITPKQKLALLTNSTSDRGEKWGDYRILRHLQTGFPACGFGGFFAGAVSSRDFVQRVEFGVLIRARIRGGKAA